MRCTHLLKQFEMVSSDGPGSFSGHAHLDFHQLIWGPQGGFVVDVSGESWFVNPSVALWMPAGIFHRVHTYRPATLAPTYLCAHHSRLPFTTPTLVAASSLMIGLLSFIRSTEIGSVEHDRAVQVMLDSMEVIDIEPSSLRLPADGRALSVALGVLDRPADDRSLAGWGREVGASVRTLSRLFRNETGLTFVAWRSRARIQASMEQLVNGASVSAAARHVGFANPSAFAESFRRSTGSSPTTFIDRVGRVGRVDRVGPVGR